MKGPFPLKQLENLSANYTTMVYTYGKNSISLTSHQNSLSMMWMAHWPSSRDLSEETNDFHTIDKFPNLVQQHFDYIADSSSIEQGTGYSITVEHLQNSKISN